MSFLVENLKSVLGLVELMDRTFLPSNEEKGYYLSQLAKGQNVTLDKIKSFLPKCHNMILDTWVERRFNLGLGSTSVKGWGFPEWHQYFDIRIFNTEEKLGFKPKEASGFLSKIFGSTSEPTRFITHNFNLISEHGKTNQLIHEVWAENGKLCERLTSTLAKDHISICSEGVPAKFPLLNKVCKWEYTPEITPPSDATAFSAGKVAGAAIGGLAFIKAVQNFRAEGSINKVRGLAWTAFGVAAIVYPNI